MPPLTTQQSDPHPQLTACRNAVQTALGGSNHRQQAASICNHLTNEQVDAVLAADGDAEKILAAITPAKEIVEEVKVHDNFRQLPKSHQDERHKKRERKRKSSAG